MKKMVIAAICAVMLGWAGVASAVSFEDLTTYGTVNDPLASNEAKTYSYDFSTTFSAIDTVNDAWLVITLTNIVDSNTVEFLVNGDSVVGEDNTVLGLLGSIDGDAYTEKDVNGVDITIQWYENGYTGTNSETEAVYYVYYFDVTSNLDASPLLDVTITAGSDPITVGALVVYGDFAPVPEPTTMLLFGAGVVGLAAASRRRERRIKLA